MASPSSPRTWSGAMSKRRRQVGGVGAEAHYEDGRYYDQAYRRRRHDVRFYVSNAVESGGPVLELGAGTGRVSFAIAEAGVDVVGIESMAPMLARAEERRGRLPRAVRERVELRRGDLERIRLRRRFPLVIAPFNVWMHLYTRESLERGFATVSHHLLPKGRFIFDVLLPDPGTMARNPAKGYRGGAVRHPRGEVKYRYTEYFSYDPWTQIETTVMDFEHPTRESESFCTPLTQRQLFPAELEALLHYNGFVVESHTGDFTSAPITAATESQVIVATLRPTRGATRRSSTSRA